MPTTPNFAIPYPCEGAGVTKADFYAYATGVDAAIGAVAAEGAAVTREPYALQVTSTVVPPGAPTALAFVASPFNFSSGITVGAASFTAITGGLYYTNVQSLAVTASVGLNSARIQVLRNGIVFGAFKRKPVVALPTAPSLGFSIDVPLQPGDVLSWQYLWVGSVALTTNLAASVSVQLMSTP